MMPALLNISVALFLGYGAVEEFWVRGIGGGEVQPLVVGLAGACVSVFIALSGVRLWQRRANARTLVVVSAILSIVFHVYAACPPHRNVGVLVLLVGAGYGLLLLGVMFMPRGRKAQTA